MKNALKFFAGIYFRVVGYGKCNWTDLLRRDSIPVNKSDKPDIRYWGDEEHIDATVYVIGSKNGKRRKKRLLINLLLMN